MAATPQDQINAAIQAVQLIVNAQQAVALLYSSTGQAGAPVTAVNNNLQQALTAALLQLKTVNP